MAPPRDFVTIGTPSWSLLALLTYLWMRRRTKLRSLYSGCYAQSITTSNFGDHALNKSTNPANTIYALHCVWNSPTHFLQNTTHCFYIRHIVQKGRLMQSFGKHIYLKYKTQLKLEKHTKSNCRPISLSHSTTPDVSSAPLSQLWKHGGRKRKRESKSSSRMRKRTK